MLISMILQKGKECTRDKPDLGDGTEPAPLFHTHYHQLQKHSKWKMKLQNNQFHSPCVHVLLIVTLASISLNYTVCIFGVCPRKVMDAYHPRPASVSL